VQRCPSKEEFSALLTREVGEDPFVTTPNLGLTVLLTPQANGVSGVVEITENGQLRGRRELNSGDCAALAAALALVVGVELDPFALAHRSQAVGPATVTNPAVEATLPVEQPRHRTQFLMGVGAMAAGGLAPSVVPGVTFDVSVRKPDWVGRWELALEFQGLPPVTTSLGGTGSGSISHLLFAFPTVCAHPVWILGLCGFFTSGVAIATGQGFGHEGAGTQTEGYAAAGLRVTTEFPLDPDLLLAIHLDGAYQITREPLQYQLPLGSPPGTPCADGSASTPDLVCHLWSPTVFTWNIGFALQGRIL
jgi:hypothetical protein